MVILMNQATSLNRPRLTKGMNVEKYNFAEVERKWQQRWQQARLFEALPDPDRPKYYGLEFFPYPSGAGLSVGHFKNYVPTDTFLRYKAMCVVITCYTRWAGTPSVSRLKMRPFACSAIRSRW